MAECVSCRRPAPILVDDGDLCLSCDALFDDPAGWPDPRFVATAAAPRPLATVHHLPGVAA